MNTILLHHTERERHLRVDIFSGLEKRDQFLLLEPVMVQLPDQHRYLTIPAGYVSDGASVPPWLWSWFPPYDNKVQVAYVVHDYLYDHWELTKLTEDDARKFADVTMLRLCLQFDKIQIGKHVLFYLACRWFGQRKWKSARQRARQVNAY